MSPSRSWNCAHCPCVCVYAHVAVQQYAFDFSAVEKPYETYNGLNVRLRYFVRVTITRNYNSITKEYDFAVQNIEQVRHINCATAFAAWCMSSVASLNRGEHIPACFKVHTSD